MKIDTTKLLILAALGVAAYTFMRRPAAQTPGARPGGSPYSGRFPGGSANKVQSGNQAAANDIGSTLGYLWKTISGSGSNNGSGETSSSHGDVVPYVPDATGESAARQYYIDNKDTYAANPPTQYTQPSGSDLLDDN